MKYKVVCEGISCPVSKKQVKNLEQIKNVEWNIIENRKFLDKLITGISASVIPCGSFGISQLQNISNVSKYIFLGIIFVAVTIIILQIVISKRAMFFVTKQNKLTLNDKLNNISDYLFILMMIAIFVVILLNL